MASMSPGRMSAAGGSGASGGGGGGPAGAGRPSTGAASSSNQMARNARPSASCVADSAAWADSAGQDAASATSSTQPLLARMCRSCMPRDAVLMGTTTAPSQPQPSTTDRNSCRLPAIRPTRSPRPTPADARRAAQLAAWPGASPKRKAPPGACTHRRSPRRAPCSTNNDGNVNACMATLPRLFGRCPRRRGSVELV
ncbi:hypothetical protein D3C71_1503840 [compost metagenome]